MTPASLSPTAWRAVRPTALLAMRPCLALLCALPLAAAQAHDYPTLDRVVYVQECMRAHPGPRYEMSSKCACVLDTLAQQLSLEEFVTLGTISKASTMAGERGGAIRDAPAFAEQLQRYRSLQARAEAGCFIGPPGR